MSEPTNPVPVPILETHRRLLRALDGAFRISEYNKQKQELLAIMAGELGIQGDAGALTFDGKAFLVELQEAGHEGEAAP